MTLMAEPLPQKKVPRNRPIHFEIPITNISKRDKDRHVVAGYAQFDVIDSQGEKITQDAMREALKNFMAEPEYANTHVMHGNCAVGKVISEYIDKNGVKWETKVDEVGTFIVSELRTDIKRAQQTWQLILDGQLKSYSIGGQSLAPKELICESSGSCHFVIDKLEIHEFSYVDRPALKGADFIIVKNDKKVAPMSYPYSAGSTIDPETVTMNDAVNDGSEPTQRVSIGSEESNIDKQGTPNSDTITMTDSSAKVNEEIADEPGPDPAVSKETETETEKADATPILLEIKAMLEKISAGLAQREESKPEPKKFDFDSAQMDALASQYGEEKSFHLLETIGEEAFKLLPAVKAEIPVEEVEEPQKEPEPEPAATEAKADEAVKVSEDKAESVSTLEEIIDEKVEASVEKYAPVQKRSLVPKETEKPKTSLQELHNTDWDELEGLASRGA